MSFINSVDDKAKSGIFSMFWWFIDPLDQDRLGRQLQDKIDRSLDASDPNQLYAPDNYDILVNNAIFIKHAHAIKTLETVVSDRAMRYLAERDYELAGSKIKLQIISSATVPKRKAEIRCWFSQGGKSTSYSLRVVEGEGKGKIWPLKPGASYDIGRISNASICLPYDIISKRHATIFFVSDREIAIVDEASANGTFVDEDAEKIKGSRALSVGSKIRLGKRDPIVLALSTE